MQRLHKCEIIQISTFTFIRGLFLVFEKKFSSDDQDEGTVFYAERGYSYFYNFFVPNQVFTTIAYDMFFFVRCYVIYSEL